MGFSRQGYWSGLPCPPPGDLPDSGIEPRSPSPCPHWQADSLALAPPGKQFSLSVALCSIFTPLPASLTALPPRQASCPPLACLTMSCFWLWSRVGDVLTLSQPLGYSSEVETKHRELSKIQGGEDSHGELSFEMLLTQKLVVITQSWKRMKYCHL